MFGPGARFGLVQQLQPRSPPQPSSQASSRDSESDYSRNSETADGDDNSNMGGIQRSDSVRSLSSLSEQIGFEDVSFLAADFAVEVRLRLTF